MNGDDKGCRIFMSGVYVEDEPADREKHHRPQANQPARSKKKPRQVELPNIGTIPAFSAYEHPLKSMRAAFVVAPGVTLRGIPFKSLLVV